MGINQELAQKAEKRAREICREIGQPEGLWQLCLPQAYDDVMGMQEIRAKHAEAQAAKM